MVVADPVAPRGERIKVLDFGIAKLAESSVFSGDGTRPSLLMGTPRYMSPEQCRGGGNIDSKSDVYSLGVMMYQLIAGKLPFDSKAAGELIVMHITEPPPPLLSLAPDLPPALIPTLVPVIERLLAKTAAARPTMSEVAQQLQGLSRQLSGQTGASAEGTPAVPPTPAAPVEAIAPEAPKPAPEGVQLTVPVAPPPEPTTAPPPPVHVHEPPRSFAPALGNSAPSGTLTATGASTLGQSVGQLRGSVLTRRRYLLAAPAAFLLVSGLLILQSHRQPAPSSAPRQPVGEAVVSASGDPAPAADARAKGPRKQWQLRSNPAGANVIRKADGRDLGRTPLVLEQPSSGGPISVELRLAGFVTTDVELHPDDDEQRLVQLSAEHRPPPPRPLIHKKKERAKGGKSFFDGID